MCRDQVSVYRMCRGQRLAWLLEIQSVGVNEASWSEETEDVVGQLNEFLWHTEGVGCKEKFLLQRYGVGGEPKVLCRSGRALETIYMEDQWIRWVLQAN